MMPAMSNVTPLFAIPEELFQDLLLIKSIIHYDVDENLWPNPQDRVDKNTEVQWGTL